MTCEIGNRPRRAQHPCRTSRAQQLPLHRAGQQALTGNIETAGASQHFTLESRIQNAVAILLARTSGDDTSANNSARFPARRRSQIPPRHGLYFNRQIEPIAHRS